MYYADHPHPLVCIYWITSLSIDLLFNRIVDTIIRPQVSYLIIRMLNVILLKHASLILHEYLWGTLQACRTADAYCCRIVLESVAESSVTLDCVLTCIVLAEEDSREWKNLWACVCVWTPLRFKRHGGITRVSVSTSPPWRGTTHKHTHTHVSAT